MPKSSLFIQIFLIVAAAALLLAGCGDEDDSSGSAAQDTGTQRSADGGGEGGGGNGSLKTGSLSKAQFIERADAICQQARDRFEAGLSDIARSVGLESAAGKVPRAEEEEKGEEILDEVLIPAYEGQIKRIEALGAPSGDEEEIAAFLSATQENLSEASADPNRYIASVGQKFTEATELAKAYGMAGCAEAMDLSQGITL